MVATPSARQSRRMRRGERTADPGPDSALRRAPAELRAQKLACSYLLTAYEQAAEKLRGFRNTAPGNTDVPDRALDILLAIQGDWSSPAKTFRPSWGARPQVFTRR